MRAFQKSKIRDRIISILGVGRRDINRYNFERNLRKLTNNVCKKKKKGKKITLFCLPVKFIKRKRNS